MTVDPEVAAPERTAILGRYAPVGGDQVEVVLLNFPLQIFADSRQRHDDLMREFALLAVRPQSEAPPVPARLLHLIDVLGRRFAGSAERGDSERDAAVARGDLTMDLRYLVPATIGPSMRQLAELMAEADEFCVSEQLLTLPSTPLDRRFQQWFCDEFVRQAEGGPPSPWEF